MTRCSTVLLILLLTLGFSNISKAADVSDACVIVEGLVFCGSKDCRTTSKGNVACGGMAKDCRTTSAGKVACGGQWESNSSMNTAN